MSGFNSPVASDEIVATDVSQFVDALNACVGIIDTAQDALGRLVLPSMTSDPGGPSNYQTWMRTDLGVGGRLKMRHSNNGGQNVPYLPLRQIVESAELAAAQVISASSLTDVSGLSVSITTTGGRLKIYLRGSKDANLGSFEVGIDCTGATTSVEARLVALVGATAHGEKWFGLELVPTSSANWIVRTPASAFVWLTGALAAGTYTVKIQGSALGASNRLLVNGAAGPIGVALVVEELFD